LRRGSGLVRVVLTDGGLCEDGRGGWVQRGEVICKLSARDARFLAIDLIQTADRAEDDEVQPPFLAEWSLPDAQSVTPVATIRRRERAVPSAP